VHLVTNIVQNVVQELNCSLTGRHALHHTEVDMLATASQILVARQLGDLEELSKMQILLGGDNVNHLVKVVLFITLEDSTNITGQIQRSTILANNDGLAQLLSAVLLKVGNDGTIGVLRDTSFLHVLVGLGHALGLDLRFSRVDVEVNVKTGIGLLVLVDTEVTEATPQGERLGVLVLHALEVTARLLILTGIHKLGNLGLQSGDILVLLLLGLDLLLQLLDGLLFLADNLVDLDVDIEQVVDGVLVQGLLVTEVLESVGQKTVLLTPVTEVVHLDHFPSHHSVEVGKETTNDGTAQMTSMERLGNVGRGELNDDLLLALRGVGGVPKALVAIGTVGFLLVQNAAQNSLRQGLTLEEEHQLRTADDGLVDEFGLGELVGEFLGQFLGVLGFDLEGRDLDRSSMELASHNLHMREGRHGRTDRRKRQDSLHGDITYRQRQVTFVQSVCPLKAGIDLGRVDLGDLTQFLGDVLAVDINGIQGGKAAGELGDIGGRLQSQSLNGGGEVGGRHGVVETISRRRTKSAIGEGGNREVGGQ